ncbi:uncharacterized protein Z518_03111 [Rhinocladiella mackenziei CBS 650.93]|uniref:CENP-V/GFA domain-containing protein n=1 Tax=Rhinocladiella mackenziei CBS 650.93 TaxID=1442369 RepID=A0A0D2JGK5_9EURO|nr:uncharacterized protein Z518_03111 [Rhinocladiella mackenziei CBS 650.93]KIX08455.1 hypothetical protein Z518_03111 [Rhinocladiella mackenziei CBS 650.93]
MASRPESISGGCVCGSIRYKIVFPEEASWPANAATCQCSTCRKWTGALISHDLLIHPSQFVDDITKSPTYKEYKSSQEATRSFCSQCGSGLTWRIDSVDDMLVIMTGTIDEEFLIGKKVEGTEEETDLGIKFERHGGLAKDLCTPHMGNLFWNNVIPGITDHDVGGTKFPQSFPQE